MNDITDLPRTAPSTVPTGYSRAADPTYRHAGRRTHRLATTRRWLIREILPEVAAMLTRLFAEAATTLAQIKSRRRL